MEDNGKEITISQEFLEYILSTSAKTLVGKVAKRFELMTNKDEIKIHVKELIYENFRDLEECFKAYSKGILTGSIKFDRPQK